MFKKAFTIIITVALLSSLFSCGRKINAQSTDTLSPSSEQEALLNELEAKISLMQSAYISLNSESKEELKKLEKELERLKAEQLKTSSETPSQTQPSIFTYKINEGNAVITGFVGNDDRIVIPSIVDGLTVKGIDEKAFDGYSVKSVIISDGVEYIDWFAFYNCPQLTSVTIPKSVTKIGYAAFDGAPKGFTIYCPEGSFAHSYAQSYGIAYAFV